jgi:hypothetical protein
MRGRGRPTLTWTELVKRDLKDWNIVEELALDRREWKLAIHVPEPWFLPSYYRNPFSFTSLPLSFSSFFNLSWLLCFISSLPQLAWDKKALLLLYGTSINFLGVHWLYAFFFYLMNFVSSTSGLLQCLILLIKGLYKDTTKNEMSLGVCSRTGDIVEPMIKPQWFVNCDTMAKASLDAVRSKKIEIIPQQYEQDWYRYIYSFYICTCGFVSSLSMANHNYFPCRWLENIRDWCVSRQLWWGHRVPAWYVTLEDDQVKHLGSDNGRWIVARNESDAYLEAQKKYPGKKLQLNQDPDVLDTWFSSGLFPLTVLGWPDDTADLHAFYPTSVLETGLDILFFWVARMVMMGMQLGGNVPFEKV